MSITVKELIELKESPVVFAERVLKLELHKGQKQILECKDRFIACRAGRRFGKSYCFAVYAAHMAATNNNCRIVCISKSKRQADELFQKIYSIITNSILVNTLTRNTKSRIEFSNGSVIESVPGRNPDSLRGPSINLILADEAAYISDDMFSAIYPTIMNVRNKNIGKIVLISTPRSYSGEFYKAFQPGSRYTTFHMKYEDAVYDDGTFQVPEEEIEMFAQLCGGRDTAKFKREHLAEFGNSEGAFFDIDGVERSICPELEQIKFAIPEHKYVISADLAVKHDFTVFVVLDYTDKTNLKVVNIVRFNGKSPDQIMTELYKLVLAFNPTNVLIDEGNIGSAIVSQLKIKYPNKRFNGFQFTSTSKVPLMTDLNIAMCTGILQLPDDDQTREELVSYYYEENPTTGHLKLNGENAHDDIPIAIALAIRAANIFTKAGGLTIGSSQGILTGSKVELSKGYNSSVFV